MIMIYIYIYIIYHIIYIYISSHHRIQRQVVLHLNIRHEFNCQWFQYVHLFCDQALWNAAIINPKKDVVDMYLSLTWNFLQCICDISELRSTGIWIGPREPLMREEHDVTTVPGTVGSWNKAVSKFSWHMIHMGHCYELLNSPKLKAIAMLQIGKAISLESNLKTYLCIIWA